MKEKSEVFTIFIKFFHMIKTKFRNSIKCLHSNNGRKYVNHNKSKFLLKMVLFTNSHVWGHHNKTILLKEKNRHLLKVTQTLLFQMYVPKSYWGKVVFIATYLFN